MKKFDWKQAEKIHSLEHIEFLRKFHDKPITEGDFIIGIQRLKKYSTSRRNKTKHKIYSPSNLKKDYRTLKERFGFFV